MHFAFRKAMPFQQCYILRYDKNCSTFDKPNCSQIVNTLHHAQVPNYVLLSFAQRLNFGV